MKATTMRHPLPPTQGTKRSTRPAPAASGVWGGAVLYLVLCWVLVLASACSPTPSTSDLAIVPLPSLEGMEETVRQQLAGRHAAVEALRQEEDIEASRLAEGFGELGQLFHAYQLYDAAEPAYRNAASLAPKDFRWPYYLGNLEQSRGDLEEAEADFRQALKIQPDHLAATLRLGRLLLDRDQADAAKPLLEKALKLEPTCAPAHYALGQIAAGQDQPQEAVDHFLRALELQPAASIVQYPLAQAYRNLGDTEAAQRHLALRGTTRLAFDDPLLGQLQELVAGSGAFLTQAGAASQQGLVGEAIAAYRASVAADPTNVTARRDLAFALAQAGRSDEAIPELEKALEMDPGSPLLHNALGVLKGQRGEVEAALAQFQAAVATDPQFEDGLFNLASAQASLGREKEAFQTLDQVLEINPQSGQAFRLRGNLLAIKGDLQGARSALEQALQLQPQDLQIRQQLAELAIGLGDRATAIELYEAILGAAPQLPQRAQLHLTTANLLREERALDRAIGHYQDALETDSALTEARFNLAGTLGLLGRYGEALPHFEALVKEAPKNEIYRLSEATALAFLGKFEALRKNLEQGIEAIPQSAALGLLLARLLAASPDEAQRDPQQALSLAEEVYAALPSSASAETLAMALAATGDFDQAANIQKQIIDQVTTANTETRDRWNQRLERYRGDSPCCPEAATGEAAVRRLFDGLYDG